VGKRTLTNHRPTVMRKSDGTLLIGNKEIAYELKDMFTKL